VHEVANTLVFKHYLRRTDMGDVSTDKIVHALAAKIQRRIAINIRFPMSILCHVGMAFWWQMPVESPEFIGLEQIAPQRDVLCCFVAFCQGAFVL